MLQSLGVNVKDVDPKVDWEAFLKLNQIMKHNCDDRQQYIDFIVKLFDPYSTGFVPDTEFESLIRTLFTSDDQ